MSGVAVVTDSTSDLDPATARRYGIAVVPLFVQFGAERYRDGVDLSRRAFYERFRDGGELPTTSQPTAAMFAEAFRPHVEAGRAIVCVVIDRRLSGTGNAATAAATMFPDATIVVCEGALVSGGLGLQAMHAAELARAGAGVAEIVAALTADRTRARGWAVVPDLSHAVRTGRVSRAQAFVGSIVKILPVLRVVGGTIEEEARVRTFARAKEAMIAAAQRAIDAHPDARVFVAHADAPALGAEVAETLRARVAQPVRSLDVGEAGPVIAAHAGPGAVGIFVVPS